MIRQEKVISVARKDEKGRVFTIELNSGSDLKKVNVPNGMRCLLVEGTIGSLRRAEFVEDTVLELVGSRGVLRVDLSREDLSKSAHRRKEKDLKEGPDR